jgi:ribosomal protein S18 acetylase RimI-like enzyme
MNLTKEAAISILKGNPDKNAFLIHSLETDNFTEIKFVGNSMAIRQKETEYYLFSLDKRGDFAELVGVLDKEPKTFFVNNRDFLDEIKEKFADITVQEYIQYNIFSGDFAPDICPTDDKLEIIPIDTSWTEFILSLYKSLEFGNKPYIDRCIKSNPGFGALLNGEKVGYVLIHMDGEIGSMVISEKARGRRVGSALMQVITPIYEGQASAGCGFVLPDNVCSQKMMTKACFSALDKNILWLYR